jgi:hypothetical protein
MGTTAKPSALSTSPPFRIFYRDHSGPHGYPVRLFDRRLSYKQNETSIQEVHQKP